MSAGYERNICVMIQRDQVMHEHNSVDTIFFLHVYILVDSHSLQQVTRYVDNVLINSSSIICKAHVK